MIIKSDLKNISFSRTPVTGNRIEAKIPDADRGAGNITPKTLTSRLGIERSLGDALSIAQMSQNVIERALAISSRLKSIAAGAMTTGKINTPELDQAFNEIKSALGGYGEQLYSPARFQTQPSVKIVELPDINPDIKSLRDAAKGLERGDYSRTENMETLHRGLSDKLTSYRAAEERITELMRETASGYVRKDRIQSVELTTHVSAGILANPELALTAQGNINNRVTDRFIT
jgi:hypothetical protein